MANHSTVAEKRNYRVKVVDDAKKIAFEYLTSLELEKAIHFGLPEVDDRYHYWRVPLLNPNKLTIGEAACKTGRRFVLFEINPEYLAVLKEALHTWSNLDVATINWIRCEP